MSDDKKHTEEKEGRVGDGVGPRKDWASKQVWCSGPGGLHEE